MEVPFIATLKKYFQAEPYLLLHSKRGISKTPLKSLNSSFPNSQGPKVVYLVSGLTWLVFYFAHL